jgi:DNA-binding NarL/FixJ family response regulator
MTDQLSERLATCESWSDSSVKVQLRIGNRLLREALIRLLEKAKCLVVAGTNGETESPDPAGSQKACDVLIADTFDPEHFRGSAGTSDKHKHGGEVKFILIGMNDDPEQFLKAIQAGVAGYLMNDASAEDIVAAVRAPFRGEAYCPPRLCLTLFRHIEQQQLQRPRLEQVSTAGLTLRQERLIDLVAKGLTNKEIAQSLNLSEFTVRNHIHRILWKLQAGNRKEAVHALRLMRQEFSVHRESINRAESREA